MNNTITVVGHVGQAPSLKSFGSGNKVAKFSVAVKQYSSNTDVERTLWIDVDAWNALADRVLKTITKGREVVVSGRLDVSQYTQEVKGSVMLVSKPVIKLTSFHLCGKKPQSKEETPAVESLKRSEKKKSA